ncbi:unnamed protein product [Camellia sinensis]
MMVTSGMSPAFNLYCYTLIDGLEWFQSGTVGFNPEPICGLRILKFPIQNRTTDSKNQSKPNRLDWTGSDYGFYGFFTQPYLSSAYLSF